ncbi:MAG: histidinol dehydrogenase [Syntrophomonadaceae bacterium]|jgi:histidinol dehydrogenase|nr:histidinol dehydrogenase [Syntrophomonadaceae bacterium]
MIKRMRYGTAEFEHFLSTSYADIEGIEARVREIGHQVRSRGDEALFDLTRQLDGADIGLHNFQVKRKEIDEAYELVGDKYLTALQAAIRNLTEFHRRQLKNSWMEPDDLGNIMGQLYRPLKRAGIYVPGGTAAYPSSVLMNAIPAQVAGVEEIAMVTPPDASGHINPYTLVAAAELGLEEIYKVGGAQAVFALAWGTDTVAAVDKITGPGNIYVTVAKKMVYGDVDIDMLAGPSEILIVADRSANPVYLAADMMSQAEHDVLARSVLVTDDEQLIDQVEEEISRQLSELSRRSIIEQSLRDYGAFILVQNLEEACQVANLVAPEHLELMVEHPFAWLGYIKNAGSIFLGQYTPEPVGDYYAGPNHILPTGGTARFYSPVTVDTFLKKSGVLFYSQRGLAQASDDIITLAEVEGLTAHANSVRVRKEDQA